MFAASKTQAMQASSLLANIFLSIASLIFFLMVVELHLKPAPRGGDYAVGHAWAVFILNLAFFACIALAAAAIGSRGGFQWAAAGSGARFWLVVFGTVAVALASAMSTLGAGDAPGFLRPVARVLAFAVPVAVIAGGFLLANDKLEGGVPSLMARRLTLVAFWPSAVLTALLVSAMLLQRWGNIFTRLTYDRNRLDSFEEGILANIDTCDITKDLVFMLVHTDANRNPIIRERALAKIKTHPNWQGELIRRLDSGWAEQAFTFLASNEVEDKTLFLEAVRLGVLQQAKIVRTGFKEGREMYEGQYGWEVERVLRTVEKFEGMGVDYLPAVRELRAAFDEPSPFGRTNVKPAVFIDKWLKKRQ
jgi:hypothetical protein